MSNATVPAFAVIITATIYCPDTDGIMGSGSCVLERHATKAAADAACAKLNEDNDECSYRVEMRPYREGETEMRRPRYSLIELRNDAWATAENCPAWAQ